MDAKKVGDLAFGIVMASVFVLLVVQVVRERRPEARWWQVLAEVKTRPPEWPLFLSVLALIGVVCLSVDATWRLVFALPVYGYLAWHLRRHPRGVVRSAGLPRFDEEPVPEPPSHVRTLPSDSNEDMDRRA